MRGISVDITTCLTRTDLDATFVRLFLVAEVALGPNAVQTHVGGLHLLGLLKVRLLSTQIQNHTVSYVNPAAACWWRLILQRIGPGKRYSSTKSS